MSLRGSAFLAIWHDIEAHGELEFSDWHTREHMPERVGIPGFEAGRRWVDWGRVRHRYFTLYEAQTIDVLSSAAYRANSVLAQVAAMRAGYGIGSCACFIGRRYADLERVLPDEETTAEIWLATHAGLRRSARIRAVFDFLAERLEASRDAFAGVAA